MKTSVLLASSLVLASGCSLVGSVTGVPSSRAPSAAPHATSEEERPKGDRPKGERAESDRGGRSDGDASASKPDDRPTVASESPLAVANLAKLLEGDARYSASTVQGAGSPICQVRKGDVPLSIWNVDSRNLDCFVMTEQSAFSRPGKFRNLRDFQDHQMFSKPAFASSIKPGEVFATVQNGGFWAAEFGEEIRLLEAPDCKKGKGMDADFLIRHLDAFCDLSTVRFDVLTKDVASAKKVDLAAERKAFVERAIDAAKKRGEASAKAEAEQLKTVRFPAAVGSDAGSIKAVKDFIADHKERTGIDVSAIKTMKVTATWSTTKSPIGLVMYRTAEVTVGFARTDAYAIDPNKKCAFASFNVQEDFDGSKFEAPQATGAMSGYTNILCDRLK